jgi:hypothetical protein
MNVPKLAKGQPCTIRHPEHCNGRTDTTVLIHLRALGGGGIGIKPHDSEAVFACSDCHRWESGLIHNNSFDRNDWYDCLMLMRALCRTHRIVVDYIASR